MKLKIRIDDPQTRAVWETVLKARAEVESWPAWKRGERTSRALPDIPCDSEHVNGHSED